jgi:hypothetical protein
MALFHNSNRITIARQREDDELHKLIRNERLNLIAIVAPGGTGKTALLLHSLQDIVLSPRSTEWIDRILYFSSKNEFLTSDGILTSNPITASIDGIKSSIVQVFVEQEDVEEATFTEICDLFAKERLLICLDNLETLLRDGPSEFDAFYQELPRNWRVIVTSRVTVNSATIMPLKPLSKKGAKALAWSYLSKRGVESVTEEELQTVVETCDRNPLAIRLTLDGFLEGKKSLAEMQTVAKQQVIEFSYRNLIEALPSTVHELLECLFVVSEPVGRTLACNLLNKGLDEISEAFNKVRGTSLVSRVPGNIEELYVLSSSIRDFLVVRPLNLDVRNAIQAELRKTNLRMREIANSQQDANPLQREYIPESIPPSVKVLAADSLKLYAKPKSTPILLFDALEKLRQAIKVQEHAILHRVAGLILVRLNDRATAKKELQIAFESNPPDVAAGLALSIELRKDQELEEAHVVANQLRELGWFDVSRSSPYEVSLLLQSYYLPLIWQGETEEVIEETKDWNSSNGVSSILGTLRAMAFRYSVELEKDINKVESALCSAVEILNEVFLIDGYAGWQVPEGMKLIEQLVYVKRGNQDISEESKKKFIDFADRHLLALTQQHRSYTLSNPDVLKWIYELSSIQFSASSNPFESVKWQRLLQDRNVLEVDQIRNGQDSETGWIQVIVCRRPQPFKDGSHKPFIFANDQNGQNYFLHRNALEFADALWDDIEVGDALEIIPGDQPQESGNYPKALDARFLE